MRSNHQQRCLVRTAQHREFSIAVRRWVNLHQRLDEADVGIVNVLILEWVWERLWTLAGWRRDVSRLRTVDKLLHKTDGLVSPLGQVRYEIVSRSLVQ